MRAHQPTEGKHREGSGAQRPISLPRLSAGGGVGRRPAGAMTELSMAIDTADLPAEIREKLAELELELSEGEPPDVRRGRAGGADPAPAPHPPARARAIDNHARGPPPRRPLFGGFSRRLQLKSRHPRSDAGRRCLKCSLIRPKSLSILLRGD